MIEDRPQSFLFQQFAGELVQRGLIFRFQARGCSMFPTIQDGEILHVQAVGQRKLRIGDIVLAHSAGEFKAHRIIRKRGDFFVTRGDGGCETDNEIHRDQILGLVIAKECRHTGRTVRIHGVAARLAFFATEARRHMATSRVR
jgi:signal peptidase I